VLFIGTRFGLLVLDSVTSTAQWIQPAPRGCVFGVCVFGVCATCPTCRIDLSISRSRSMSIDTDRDIGTDLYHRLPLSLYHHLYLSICLSVCLFVHLSVCLCISLRERSLLTL